MTTQGTQVTLTIPDGALPGMLLSVPVKGGSDTVKVRVPDGLGPGSTLILTQAAGTDEWNLEVGTIVPAPPQDEQEEEPMPTSMEEVTQQYAAADQAAMFSTDRQIDGGSWPGYAGQTEVAPSEQAPMQPYQPVEPHPGPVLEGAIAYTVRLETTVGAIDIIVRPDWAPNGCRRFLELAASGDLCDLAFYRAIKGCIVQFGLPAKRPWPPIPDDPPTGVPFLLGAVSFAAIGENTRRSTLFICIGDMSHMLGQKSWETPIGAVAESSLDVLEHIETAYGDIAEFGGAGPDTTRINSEGNNYLQAHFPALTYIRSAWPLDWQSDESQSLPQATPTQPLPATGMADQAQIAARAAQEAQLQAQQAVQAADQAALAEYRAQAQHAAQVATAAAQAAQAAAEALFLIKFRVQLKTVSNDVF